MFSRSLSKNRSFPPREPRSPHPDFPDGNWLLTQGHGFEDRIAGDWADHGVEDVNQSVRRRRLDPDLEPASVEVLVRELADDPVDLCLLLMGVVVGYGEEPTAGPEGRVGGAFGC